MCKTISTMGMEHEEWLRLRKGGIGGSDAGAVCGLKSNGGLLGEDNGYVGFIG